MLPQKASFEKRIDDNKKSVRKLLKKMGAMFWSPLPAPPLFECETTTRFTAASAASAGGKTAAAVAAKITVFVSEQLFELFFELNVHQKNHVNMCEEKGREERLPEITHIYKNGG